jgi:signal transduction histidine kinase
MFIDIKTAYFLLGFLYVVMPISVYFYLKNYRSNAVKYWCFGGVLNGLGLVIISFRPYMLDNFPDFFTFTLVNILIVSGYCLRIQSLRMDMKRSVPNYLLVAFILVFGIAYHLCVIFGDGLGPRVIFALSVISTLLLVLAWNGKVYEQHFALKRVGYIATIYGLLGLAILVKVLLLILGYESHDVLQRSTINTIMTITGILAVIYSNLGYVALVLAKVEKDYSKSVADNREMSGLLEKRNVAIKEMMRAQAFSTVGAYGATVVHEVLQPLTALRFGLANLESYILENNDDKDDSKLKARLLAVSQPAERAVGVIEDLRRFMVERNIEIKPVPIDEVLANVINLQQSRLSKLGVNFSVVSTISNGHVLADQHQLERVVFNLLNNALDAIEQNNQATPNKSILIKLQYIQQKQFVIFKIVDSGEGIPEGMENKIFDWMESNSGGMGIGLALSRMLVESWQGTLTAYSANDLVDGLSGAVFELKLRASEQ